MCTSNYYGTTTYGIANAVRKINTRSFVRATRSTPREINRQIVLNLVREHQPISRADLARRMHVGRGMVTSIVSELLVDGSIYEGSTVEAPRGRKPMMLHVRTHDRLVVAVDVRFSKTYVMAAPVVSGLAALVLSYYPNLTASDLKKIIMSSVSRHADQMVLRPGSDSERVPFGSLSISGGIVNAYNALKMAEEISAGKARP